MTLNKRILLLSAVSALTACSASGPRYVPRPDVSLGNYTDTEKMEDRSDRRAYNAYEEREPCQNYRAIPRNTVELDDCNVMREQPPGEIAMVSEKTTTTTMRKQLLPIIRSYTVYFDFDRFGIRANQETTLNQIGNEIETYKPSDVTVTGYTDRSGKASYNQELSRKRAHSVSVALQKHGIANEEIDQQARGETDNAVQTADGVKLQENRRVVIDFRR